MLSIREVAASTAASPSSSALVSFPTPRLYSLQSYRNGFRAISVELREVQRVRVDEGVVSKGVLEHFDYVLKPKTPLASALATTFGLDFVNCDANAVEVLRLQVGGIAHSFKSCVSCSPLRTQSRGEAWKILCALPARLFSTHKLVLDSVGHPARLSFHAPLLLIVNISPRVRSHGLYLAQGRIDEGVFLRALLGRGRRGRRRGGSRAHEGRPRCEDKWKYAWCARQLFLCWAASKKLWPIVRTWLPCHDSCRLERYRCPRV